MEMLSALDGVFVSGILGAKEASALEREHGYGYM
jgi:hypothetical protein